MSILYIASHLPSLSETFVYRELLGLRRSGVQICAASVHAVEEHVGDDDADQLCKEIIPIYGAGLLTLLADGIVELYTNPVQSFRTFILGLRDSSCGRDLTFRRRLRVIGQALAAIALARRLRPRGIAHLHAHMAHVPTTLAMYAARQLRVGFSFTGHANDLFVQRTLLAEKLRRACFVACISEWHRRFYRELQPLTDERLPIVRCGVSVPKAAAPCGSHAAPRLLAVGRLVRKKGFDTLIHALAELQERSIEVSCDIVGSGSEQEALWALVVKFGLEDRVQLTGAMSNLKVRRLMGDIDLFVLPCRITQDGDRDGIPVVLMEAMAAGVCVISGDLPAIRELVRDGETGVLVPPGDSMGLAQAIRDLLLQPERRRVLGLAGRAWVQQEFSEEVNVRRLMEAFRQIGAIGSLFAGVPT